MENSSKIVSKAIQGFKFTFVAQVIVLVLGIMRSLVLPKILPVDEFGYWQVYLLYASYVGVFALGFNDGIYLIYGKYQYSELPFSTLRTTTKLYIAMLTFFTMSASILCLLLSDTNRRFAMIFVALNILTMGINGLLVYVLQITNQMKKYSFYSVIDKVIMLVSVVLISFLPNKCFQQVIVMDLFAKTIVTVALMIQCRELIWGKGVPIGIGIKEFLYDMKVGINLMIANLMGMFVVGLGRFVVDLFGDITEYAYYSFGISITNLVLVLIAAVSLVLYPALKRLSDDNYNKYFNKINSGLVIFNYFTLFAYFPAVMFVRSYLPDYTSMLPYLNLLFAIVILQSKMQILNNTFYKVLRKEKALLKANMSCVLIFVVLAFITFGLTKSVWFIAFSTFLAMLFQCYASEIYLRSKMNIQSLKSIIIEITYIVGFIVISSNSSLVFGLLIYLAIFIIFAYIYRRNFVYLFRKEK